LSASTRNLDYATSEKSKIEDNQRMIVKGRIAENVNWEPRYFTQEGDDWIFKGPK